MDCLIRHILDILDGFSNFSTEQCTAIFTVKWISAAIKQRSKGQFIQKWTKVINNSSKGQIYKIYKLNFGFEKIPKHSFKTNLETTIKFRTSNHRLPIETG